MDEGRFYYDDFSGLDHPKPKHPVKFQATRTGNKFTCNFFVGQDGGLGQGICLGQYRIDNYTGDFMPKKVNVTGTCKFKPYGIAPATGLSARPKFPAKK
ncbi:hypothetical protein CALCODRAFT_501359 [Calocera cornea HHB12733]|uniref:Uncharacterized protein n=1 Tax=Calocera cornea HHB12733 TaxID=1353952 RepID=A0A165DNZ5_9BASI|nr:hypothetical protein CALCODRAFT_501359 [Calocera cornea HHB12733]